MDTLVERLKSRLAALRAEIDALAAEAGRDGAAVGLVAISKYATAVETGALARAMHELGVPVRLGESRVQALTQKAGELAGSPFEILWELVGSLQRNKALSAARTFARIHSLDREAILRTLDEIGGRLGRVFPGFVQVNVSGEPNKHGFVPENLPAALELAAGLPHVAVEGLMCMAPRGTDHETARPSFAELRELRERHAPGLRHLSMGMSGDYRGAILEGATVLRIGSAIFRG